MRLSQIARKLTITQSEIIKLFVAEGAELPKGGNTKLSEDQLALITKKFGEIPEDPAPEEIVVEVDEPKIETSAVEELVVEPAPEPTEEPKEELTQEVVIEKPEPEEPVEEIEVIRVQKIKLDGIKVLGKINLPEPVKKVKKEEVTEEVDIPEQPTSKRQFTNQTRRKPHKKAPLTFEQKQALEEKKRAKAKQEREQKLKERKKDHYYSKVAPKVTKAPVKKKVKKETDKTQRTKITTKNPFKRFWLWLNDPYA